MFYCCTRWQVTGSAPRYQAIVRLDCVQGQEYAGHLVLNQKDAEKFLGGSETVRNIDQLASRIQTFSGGGQRCAELAQFGTGLWHRAWVSIVSGPLPSRPSLLSHKATFFRSSRCSLRTRTAASFCDSTDAVENNPVGDPKSQGSMNAPSFDPFCSAGSSEDKKKKKQTKLTPEEHALRKAKLMSLVTSSGSRASLGKCCDFAALPLCKAKQEEEGNPAVTPKTLLNARSSA